MDADFELPLPAKWTTVARRDHAHARWVAENPWLPSVAAILRMGATGDCLVQISRAGGRQRLRARAVFLPVKSSS